MNHCSINQTKILNRNIIYGVIRIIRSIKTRQVQPTPPPNLFIVLQSKNFDLGYVSSIGKYYIKNKSPKPKIFTYSGVCTNENNCNHSRVGYANTSTT